MGICSGEMHLNTAYQAALESLKLGKALFPDEHLHSYDKMKLAIALSKTAVPGLEQEFQQLCRQGKNAQLAETAVAYLRLNGDIQKSVNISIYTETASPTACTVFRRSADAT